MVSKMYGAEAGQGQGVTIARLGNHLVRTDVIVISHQRFNVSFILILSIYIQTSTESTMIIHRHPY
jgi:hypothetical protein